MTAPIRMMSKREVCNVVGLSPSTIDRQVKDGVFPSPIKVSKRRVAWTETAILQWQLERGVRSDNHSPHKHQSSEVAGQCARYALLKLHSRIDPEVPDNIYVPIC
jgi:predicted DNA-binding transcriptional regulator AlpA